GDARYVFSVLFTITGGPVLSFSPEMSKSGPRFGFATFTLVAEFGLKFAVAAWNRGRPGAGIAYRSYNSFASCSGSALVKPNRNWCSVSETARLKLSGLLRTGNDERSAERGSSGTPLIGAGSIAIPAAARVRPSRFWTSSPPKEWPMRIGCFGGD